MEERNPSSELKTEWEYYGEDISDTRKHEYIRMAAMLSKDAEWLLEKMPHTFEWRLEALGSERWELVTATFIPIGEYRSFWKMIFKRPKLQTEHSLWSNTLKIYQVEQDINELQDFKKALQDANKKGKTDLANNLVLDCQRLNKKIDQQFEKIKTELLSISNIQALEEKVNEEKCLPLIMRQQELNVHIAASEMTVEKYEELKRVNLALAELTGIGYAEALLASNGL